MRHIILDTETTGISPEQGDRIVEIGCVEMINRRLTGQTFHVYINPERHVPEEVVRIHGLDNAFLADKPKFSEIVDAFLAFIKDSELIIHNAKFDMNFLDHECQRLNLPSLTGQIGVIDSLLLARKLYPGQRNSLDALCKRYSIDNSNRTLHGALLDSELLALVYLAMTGGQGSLSLDNEQHFEKKQGKTIKTHTTAHATRVIRATSDELAAHQQFINSLLKTS